MNDQRNEAEVVRVFLDANVMYSAAQGGGGSAKLWSLDGIQLVTTEFAANEAYVNLEKERDCDAKRAELERLLRRVEVRHLEQPRSLFVTWELDDPDDVPILLGAIEFRCQYLLTLDRACFGKHMGQSIDGVTIMKPGTFLRLRGV